MQLFMCLVASFVVMATAAPIANEDPLINTGGSDELNRAKREQEQVYFGNQQNKARIPSKRSDKGLSTEISSPDVLPQGEEDIGGVVLAHKETPISADLESRIEATQEGSDQKAQIGEAMESAMHNAVASVVDEASSQESSETAETESSEEPSPVDDAGNNEGDDDGDSGDDTSENENSVNDDVEKELQEATESQSQDAGETTENSEESSSENSAIVSEQSSSDTYSNDDQNADVQDFLTELQKADDTENSVDDPSQVNANMNDYYKNIYQYMSPTQYPDEQDPYTVYPYLPIYYRRRRSSPHFRRNQPLSLGKSRRTRRIKRDLFDDLALSDTGDSYNSESDDFLPLSDEELEYLYSKFLPYLAEAYAEENEEDNGRYDTLDSPRPYSLFDESVPEEETAYEPQIPLYPERPYEELEMSAPVQNEYPFEKRDISDYYAAPQRKRYFFPFSDEPETHWGAFVPEKRGYDEAIRRLQRLAMALSDEPEPYYSELMREYEKK